MDKSRVAEQGLVLLGCGKMGSAMLAGWLNHGLPAASVWLATGTGDESCNSIIHAP